MKGETGARRGGDVSFATRGVGSRASFVDII